MTTTRDELAELYHEWMEAVKNKDMETLERIVAEDFTYSGSGQGRFSRQGYLEIVPIYDLRRFRFETIDIREYGDVVVALPHYWQEAVVGGSARSGDFLITDVWVKRDGQWQVVARSSMLAG